MTPHDGRPIRRVAWFAASLTIAGVLVVFGQRPEAATSPGTGAPISSAAKPTIVLVHGAFADASTFSDITRRLQHDGYAVQAPAVPLRSIAGDTAYLRSVLDTITGPIVLVGHSYSGALISNVAAGDPRIRALVFVAAFLPDVGQTLSQANAGSKDLLLGPDGLDVRPYATAGGGTAKEAYVKEDRFHEIMAEDVPSGFARVLAASQRPADVATFTELVSNAGWKTIPSWCLVPKGDHAVGADAERAMANRAHCHTTEVSGSHLVMLVKPDVVATIIEDAARATSH